MSDSTDVATVAGALRLGAGVSPEELPEVVERFAKLDNRLRSYPSGGIELILNMKERGQASQRTTLEARVTGQTRLVATSTHRDTDEALNEVRDDILRQLTDQKNRSEPRQNRQLRSKPD